MARSRKREPKYRISGYDGWWQAADLLPSYTPHRISVGAANKKEAMSIAKSWMDRQPPHATTKSPRGDTRTAYLMVERQSQGYWYKDAEWHRGEDGSWEEIKRTKNRARMVEVRGRSADELRKRGWSVFGPVDRVEGNIAWVVPTIPGDKKFGVPLHDLGTHGRLMNPDADKVAAAGKRYERALERHLRAIQEGRDIEAARKEIREAERDLSRALGPGVPISVVVGAVGAGLGAAVGGPVGAAAGAVAGGAIPMMVAGRRRREEAQAQARTPNARKLKNRLMR